VKRPRVPTAYATADEDRAREYSRAKIWYFVAGLIISTISTSVFVFSGSGARIADFSRKQVRSRRVSEGLTITLFMLLSWLASLPLAYLRGYRLEHRYGLSNQSLLSWAGDQLKVLALQVSFLVPVSQVALGVIRRWPRHWWAILSAMALPFTVILAHLFPVLIAPLFNKYQPLRDEELAESLKALAARSGIHVADVLEMDMSRQTKKANAFFAGLGNTKRIVLADTLLEEFTPEEIETIVAHEIAHQAHRDIWRLLALGTVTTAAIAWVTQLGASRLSSTFGRRAGIRDLGTAEALPLLGLVGSITGLAMMPVQNAASRYIERQADDFALRLTDNPAAFESALNRLKEMNLAEASPPKLEAILLHSHPPISQRIETCQEYARERTRD
jgi:STE24 endopeptidase